MRYRTCTGIAALAAVCLAGVPRSCNAQPTSDAPPGAPAGVRFAVRPFGGDVLLGDGPGMMLPLMLHQGDLTAEQQQRVQEIMSADRERLHTLFEQLDAANHALAAKVIEPGAVDAAALQPDVERVARLRKELMEQGLKTALAMRAVLTPEQLAKAAQRQARLRQLQAEMRELLE